MTIPHNATFNPAGPPYFGPPDPPRELLTRLRREQIDSMVGANATDRAMFKWLVEDGMSRHDAHVAIDYYVYGEPVTCQPLPQMPAAQRRFTVIHSDAEAPKVDPVYVTDRELAESYPELAPVALRPDFTQLDVVFDDETHVTILAGVIVRTD